MTPNGLSAGLSFTDTVNRQTNIHDGDPLAVVLAHVGRAGWGIGEFEMNRHRLKGLLGGGLAVLLLTITPSSVGAWTQEANKYPSSPQSCDNTPTNVCVRWPKTSNNLSVTVLVLFDTSLSGANLDLAADGRNVVIPDWNGIAARNPHLASCSCQNEGIFVQRVALAPGTYSNFGGTQTNAVPALFTSGDIKMSTLVTWNHSLSCPDATHCDDRAAMSHEMGHAEGLGHTGFTQSVMGGLFYNPQTNDRQGIVAIYGAYP